MHLESASSASMYSASRRMRYDGGGWLGHVETLLVVMCRFTRKHDEGGAYLKGGGDV